MNYTWPEGMIVKPLLAWPGRLTARRQRSNFSAPWGATLGTLRTELRNLKARTVVLQVAIPEAQFRIDGYPRATARAEHPGIILSMDSMVGPLSYPCDTFDRWEDNLRGIALALEALRKVDRYGVTKRGEQYQGFKALPPGSIALGSAMSYEDAARALAELAGADVNDEGTLRLIRNDSDFRARTYRRAAKRHHPDVGGGDGSLFKRLNDAASILQRGPVAG